METRHPQYGDTKRKGGEKVAVSASPGTTKTSKAGGSKKPLNRSVAFTTYHITCLINLFKKHKDVLLNEHRTSMVEEAKRNAWIDITKSLNAKVGRDWTPLQIRTKWKGLLSKARMDFYWAREAARLREPIPDVSAHSEVIWEIYGPKLELQVGKINNSSDTLSTPEIINSLEDHCEVDFAESLMEVAISTPNDSFSNTSKKRTLTKVVHDDEEEEEEDGLLHLTGNIEKHVKALMMKTELTNNNGNSTKKKKKKKKKNDSFEREAAASTRKSGGNMQKEFVETSDNPVESDIDEYFELEEETELYEGDEEAWQFDEQKTPNPHTTNTDSSTKTKGDIADDEGEGALRRRLLKAQIARIELENTKTESELEKLDMEKERINLDKKRIELEMFLIRQKINTLCSMENSSGHP